jgi:two-component system response regulator AtoC
VGLQLVVMGERGSLRVDLPGEGTVELGRAEEAAVRIDDPSISRSHARLHIGRTLQLEDRGSSNGTFVHGQRLDPGLRADISPGEFFEVGTVVCVVRGPAAHDRLRQLRSHEYFEARLQDEVARARRSQGELVVARVHLERDADDVVAELLAAVRPGDVVARYAPHEYEVLLVDAGAAPWERFARDLQRRLRAHGHAAPLGPARFPVDGGSAEELFTVACERVRPAPPAPSAELIVADPAMRRLHDLVARVAGGGINVLLLGETGVGKEVFAARLHALSPRAAAPLVKLNCAAFSDTLLESELFGHEKGAFTGADRRKIGLLEAAEGGMVFLDEVGELAPAAQAKLLRVLEERALRRVGGVDTIPIDVLFIGATNRDLETEVAERRFRADLYFRLNGFSITIPPLRQRLDEIAPLAERFLAAAARRMGLAAAPKLSESAREALVRHRWPGNIRELRNAIDRAVLLADGGPITAEHLPSPAATARPAGGETREEPSEAAAGAGDVLGPAERAERDRIIEALAATGGSQTRAAERLGISRRWLSTKMARYLLPRPRKR